MAQGTTSSSGSRGAVATRGFSPPRIHVHSTNTSAREKMNAGGRSIERMTCKQNRNSRTRHQLVPLFAQHQQTAIMAEYRACWHQQCILICRIGNYSLAHGLPKHEGDRRRQCRTQSR